MAKQRLELLTESMFYVLMAFLEGEKCGIEIAEFISTLTKGRVTVGPGTLYTTLSKYEEAGYIEQTKVEGRKRTYRITPMGRDAWQEEVERMRQVLQDAGKAGGTV